MNKILLTISALLFSTVLLAQAPDVPADKGANFGVKTNEKDAITADALAATVQGKENVAVKVKGKVIEVCKAEGCWLKMETANGNNIMVRMKDHAFFVPVAINGKTIVAEGVASIKETPVETLRHYAEDAGKSKEEIEAIKEPKKEILLKAQGILVM